MLKAADKSGNSLARNRRNRFHAYRMSSLIFDPWIDYSKQTTPSAINNSHNLFTHLLDAVKWLKTDGGSISTESLSTQRKHFSQKCVWQRPANKCQYMMIYSNICQYMSIYGSRLDLRSISFYSVKVHHLLESLHWNNLEHKGTIDTQLKQSVLEWRQMAIWAILEVCAFENQGSSWCRGQCLSHLSGSSHLIISHLPTNRLPICPDLPRFACCYAIICITRSLTQQLKQQYQTITKLGGNTSTATVPRTTRSLMKHSCNLSKARTLEVEHAIPGRQGSGQKTATGKKSENQRTSEHLNTFDRFWQRVDASNRKTSSGTNIQSNSR